MKMMIGSENASIQNSIIYGEASIDCNIISYICNSEIYGDAEIKGISYSIDNANIYQNNHFLTITPIGSEDGTLTAYIGKVGEKNEIIVRRGCFKGALDTFKEAVTNSHYNRNKNKIYDEYQLVIQLIEKRIVKPYSF